MRALRKFVRNAPFGVWSNLGPSACDEALALPISGMADEREQNVYLAKLAEQAERYDEMAEKMKKVAEAKQELSVEERNLISVAYKNAVGSRRASWRIISSVEQKEGSKGNTQNQELAKSYRNRVEAELNRICDKLRASETPFLG